MANDIAKARSNHFKVKNETTFRQWASSRKLGVWTVGQNESKQFAIYADGPNEDGWPLSIYDEESGEEFDVCVESELARHLEDGSVAVLITTGSIGYMDLYGYAVAVNSKSEEVWININEIYERARHLGGEIDTM